ncbi:hypothetical protein CARUB_v10021698mg, partial [Capsella rubella]
ILILLLTEEKMLSLSLLLRYIVNISFFTTGLYILAPIYQTLTRSISSDSIWAVTVSLLLLHLFLHDYSGSTISNAYLLHVFAVMLFSVQVFLFAPLVTYCIKKFSFGLHLLFSFALMEYKFEINGPWDEAKLCFDITD